jgi:hypothetical protein
VSTVVQARAAKFQAALQSGGGSSVGGVGGPAARPQQDCYFFSIGQCRKGDACPFRHDPVRSHTNKFVHHMQHTETGVPPRHDGKVG